MTATLPTSTLEQRFAAFHEANSHVFEMFKKLTWRAIDAGKTRIGAKALFEVIRWQTWLETTGDHFRINNSYVSFYARMWMIQHPQYAHIFQIRERKEV